MTTDFEFIVIGAGIVGLATAWELSRRHPGAGIALVEKERGAAAHQSGHNSGVIHAGVYYAPGSLKARLCRQGVQTTLDFCREHGVPATQCGKLIVATSASEEERLVDLAARATNNGLDIERLDAAAVAEREPEVAARAAIFVRDTGIADYPALCQRLVDLLQAAGASLFFAHAVTRISEQRNHVEVEAGGKSLTGRKLIACAGLQADRVARLAGLDLVHRVVPFRGDYYTMPATRSNFVSTLIYPVPDPRLPFLGVHLTLTTTGRITIGPTAMLALARERYRKWAFELSDARDALGFSGTWHLLRRFPAATATEFSYALARRLYLRAARRYCPGLELLDLAQHACGIRAQLVAPDGTLVHDFQIEQSARMVHVLNAPSPAATAAFPIAASLVERLSTPGT